MEEITLHQNGITWQGAVALANCFKVNPKLRVINLNDNILTEKGAMAIAEAIELLPNLEVLDLGDCLCRTDGLLKESENFLFPFLNSINRKLVSITRTCKFWSETNRTGLLAIGRDLRKKVSKHITFVYFTKFIKCLNEFFCQELLIFDFMPTIS